MKHQITLLNETPQDHHCQGPSSSPRQLAINEPLALTSPTYASNVAIDADNDHNSLYLNPSDTYISLIVSKSKSKVCLRMIQSPIIIILLILLTIIYFIWNWLVILNLSQKLPNCISLIDWIIVNTVYISWIIYPIFLILLLNYHAMKFVMKTFDFWIKVLYSFRILIAIFVDSNFMQYYANIAFVLTCILLTVSVASFDALFMKVQIKITLAIIIDVILIFCFVNALIMDESTAEKFDINIANSVSFVYEPLSEVKNCLQVVIIFVFRQFILLVYHKNDNCCLLSNKKKILWMDAQTV